jgi:4-amino-4-deoxy-L-arabinose transferase-like glycosyltransferase
MLGAVRASRVFFPDGRLDRREPSSWQKASSSDVPVLIKLAQASLGAIAVLLIAALGGRAAGPTAAVLAAWFAAVYPPLVWICAYVLSEPLYSVLALGAALLLARAGDADSRHPGLPAFAAGVVAGLAILTREAMLLFLPMAAAWLLWRQRPRLAALLVAGALLAVAPWTAWNYRGIGTLQAGAAHGGINFWIGNNPLARGEGDLATNPEMKRSALELEARHPGAGPDRMDRIYYREALGYIASEPAAWVGLLGRKLFYTFVPIGPSYTLRSGRYFYASVASYLLIMLPACAGLVRAVSERRGPSSLWLLGLSAVATNLVFFPLERFRIPVIDPVLIVLAAIWGEARLGRRRS